MYYDKYQKEIINYQGNLLVIAGAGSGKTTTIVGKIKYLLSFYDEKDFLVISFTNKSVDDLKQKLSNNIFVTTFHKLAIDILKYNNINFNICNNYLLDYIIEEYIFTLNQKERNTLLRHLNITKLDKDSYEYQSFIRLIKTFINLFYTNNYDINKLTQIKNNYKNKFILKIVFNILNIYINEKKSTNTLDYDDLIIFATKILKNGLYKNFKIIIIDEFQDTSLIRLNLIKEIYNQNKATITVVGDDAQSIYHFSGCNLNIFLNFQNYFPNVKILKLKYTYRYSKELLLLTERFINKNPYQIKKDMIANTSNKDFIEYIYYHNPTSSLKKVLNNLLNKDVMILIRNKFDIYKYLDKDIKINDSYLIYKNTKFKYLTIHSAKGLESTYIIILNVANSLLGIPNRLENHKLINMLDDKIDKYKYSEERRIFYVALTRCKEKVFLLIPKSNPSYFIKELKK